MLAVTKISRFCVALFVLATCVGCDQVTKQIASETLRGMPPLVFFGEAVSLRYAENTGAFLGLGQTLPPT